MLHRPFLRLALGGLGLGLAMSVAGPAQARDGIVDRVASAARGCVTTSLCSATPTTRALGTAIRSADRLGWNAGRYISIRQHGPQGDPGRYPGIRR